MARAKKIIEAENANGAEKPQVEIVDPIDELKDVFTKKTSSLEKLLKGAINKQNQITMFVIMVMAIGFLLLLFALATVLITSWQSSQSVHDAVQLEINSSKSH